jgi:hypothetical protein
MKSDLYVRVMIYGSFEDRSLLSNRLFTCGTKKCLANLRLNPRETVLLFGRRIENFIHRFHCVESDSKAFDIHKENFCRLHIRILYIKG